MLTVAQRLDGSAYREDRLVCARVAVTIVADAPAARRVRVRFVDGVDRQLRGELERLMARRGAFATRLAERLDPVEIVGRDPGGARHRLVGRLERPAGRCWPPADAEFGLRESTEPADLGARAAQELADGRGLRPASVPRGRR